MSTLRRHLHSGFAAIPNETARDGRLSYRATGILTELLSHVDGWPINAAEMAKHRPEGRDAIQVACRELRALGYMRVVKYRLKSGEFHTVVDVSDHPIHSWIGHDSKVVVSLDTDTIPCAPEPDYQAPVDRAPVGQAPSTSRKPRRTPPTPRGGGARLPLDDGAADATVSVPVAIQQVWDAWTESTGKTRSVLSNDRSRRIAKALKDYPLADVLDAVRGWKFSPHHRGENDRQQTYNDIGLLLRNAEKIEYFRDAYRHGQRTAKQALTAPTETYR